MLLSLITGLNNIRPVVTAGALVAVSPTVFIAHSAWTASAMLLPRRIYYKVEDALWGWYQNFVVFVFETCLGVEIVLDGVIPKNVENSIFICNHQSAMDWIVADMIANRQGMIGHMRYVFKDALKYIPLFGYIFGKHGGVFVKRDGNYNAGKMCDTVRMLCDNEVPVYLVIYPEGTRYNPKRKELTLKSRDYAVKNSMKPLNHVLTPRVKAFHSALSAMGDDLKAVYDATIIYENTESMHVNQVSHVRQPAPSMWDVVSGRCRRIYIKFDRIDCKDVPFVNGMEAPTFKWLHHRFELKDAVFDKFYFAYDEDKSDKVDLTKYLNKHVPLQSARVVFPSIVLAGITMSLLCSSIGRKIYFAAVFGGSVFGIVYSALVF